MSFLISDESKKGSKRELLPFLLPDAGVHRFDVLLSLFVSTA